MLKLNPFVLSGINQRVANASTQCTGSPSSALDANATRPVFLVKAYLYISSIACLIALALNLFYIPNLLVAMLDGIALLVSVAVIVDLRLYGRVQRAIYISTINFFFLFVSLAYLTHGEGFALIWTIFFPILTISLLGHKKGLWVTLLFYAVIFVISFQGLGVWDYGHWSVRSFIRLVMVSVILTYIVYVYESFFYRANIELVCQREKEAAYLEELRLLSITDPLTGLYNRRQMNEILKQHIAVMQSPHCCSLIIFDIDNFKSINDRLGHNVGDQVLMIISGIAKENLTDAYPIARWGGEEFLILLPHLGIDDSMLIAEKLRQVIVDAYYPHDLHVTCSFGVAAYQQGTDTNEVVNQADKALYQAKNNGKNQVVRAE